MTVLKPYVSANHREGLRYYSIGPMPVKWAAARAMDFSRGQVLVRRNIPARRHVEIPKTAASERKVDLSPELAAELKRVLVERKKEAFAAGKAFDMEQ